MVKNKKLLPLLKKSSIVLQQPSVVLQPIASRQSWLKKTFRTPFRDIFWNKSGKKPLSRKIASAVARASLAAILSFSSLKQAELSRLRRSAERSTMVFGFTPHSSTSFEQGYFGNILEKQFGPFNVVGVERPLLTNGTFRKQEDFSENFQKAVDYTRRMQLKGYSEAQIKADLQASLVKHPQESYLVGQLAWLSKNPYRVVGLVGAKNLQQEQKIKALFERENALFMEAIASTNLQQLAGKVDLIIAAEAAYLKETNSTVLESIRELIAKAKERFPGIKENQIKAAIILGSQHFGSYALVLNLVNGKSEVNFKTNPSVETPLSRASINASLGRTPNLTKDARARLAISAKLSVPICNLFEMGELDTLKKLQQALNKTTWRDLEEIDAAIAKTNVDYGVSATIQYLLEKK
ncbi:MAG: hypothetical protein WCW13_04510 [archaeon]|jgi:hypothetical protein